MPCSGLIGCKQRFGRSQLFASDETERAHYAVATDQRTATQKILAAIGALVTRQSSRRFRADRRGWLMMALFGEFFAGLCFACRWWFQCHRSLANRIYCRACESKRFRT